MQLSTRSNIAQEQQKHPGDRLMWLPTGAVLAVIGVMATGQLASSPPIRLLMSTVVLYLAFKVAAALKQRKYWADMNVEGWLWYWTVWPGMQLKGFTTRSAVVDNGWLVRGLGGMSIGLALLGSITFVDLGDYATGWLAVVGLLTTVHFGYADVLSWFMRTRGFNIQRLFKAPEQSKTLNDFWTRRWNVAFVEMDRVLFMPALRKISRRWAPLLMLLLSGLLHELALSYPAGGGWGLPMIYFAIHGAGMHLERLPWFAAAPRLFKLWWTRILVLAPAGLVFHGPFREALPLQLITQLKGLL